MRTNIFYSSLWGTSPVNDALCEVSSVCNFKINVYFSSLKDVNIFQKRTSILIILWRSTDHGSPTLSSKKRLKVSFNC